MERLFFSNNDGKFVKTAYAVRNSAEYKMLRDTPMQEFVMKAIRENGNTEKKHKLLQCNYNLLIEDGGELKNCFNLSRSCACDIDFPSDGAEKIAEAARVLVEKKDELGLLMLEKSASKGLHAAWLRRVWGYEDLTDPQVARKNQIENLEWFKSVTGLQYDTGAKDVQRIYYTTTTADLLHLDERLFDLTPCDVADMPLFPVPTEDSLALAPANVAMAEETAINQPADAVDEQEDTYGGIKYADIISKLLTHCKDGKNPAEGDRNNTTFLLACQLRYVCGHSKEKLMRVIPNYFEKEGAAGKQEHERAIESALSYPVEPTFPAPIRKVLSELAGLGDNPPELPTDIPPIVKFLIRNTPDYYKAIVASSVFAPLGVYLKDVKFKHYATGMPIEPNFLSLCIADQSRGKSTAIKPVVDCILEMTIGRDRASREREEEWKRENRTTKSKGERPADICVQVIGDATHAAFMRRLKDAELNGNRRCYTFCDEIENLRRLADPKTTEQACELIKNAWDNSVWNKERSSDEAESLSTTLRFNFNATTTPMAARQFFRKNLMDGTLGRLDMCSLVVPTEVIKSQIRASLESGEYLYGDYDAAFKEELKGYIKKLEGISGTFECKEANNLAGQMRLEDFDMAEMLGIKAIEDFSARICDNAFVKGMVLYICNDCQWSEDIAAFMRFTHDMHLWTLLHYFGKDLERLSDDYKNQTISKFRGRPNSLEELPDEFTKEQFLSKFQDKNLLYTWKSRGYIFQDDSTGKYHKTGSYKQRYLI